MPCLLLCHLEHIITKRYVKCVCAAASLFRHVFSISHSLMPLFNGPVVCAPRLVQEKAFDRLVVVFDQPEGKKLTIFSFPPSFLCSRNPVALLFSAAGPRGGGRLNGVVIGWDRRLSSVVGQFNRS